jgi:biotin operon repressor
MTWKQDETDRLIQYKQMGWSGAEIGKALNKSRSAILAKLDRLKNKKGRIYREVKNPPLKKPFEIKEHDPRESVKITSATAYGRRKTLDALCKGECCYPLTSLENGIIGTPVKWFCGGKVFKRGYCEDHYNICYQRRKNA